MNRRKSPETKTESTPGKREDEDPRALKVTQTPTETQAEALAHTSIRPTTQAALTVMDYNKGFGEISINTLVDDLARQCELASGGDLRRSEAILTAQAHTLDAIFNALARRAQQVGYLKQYETYLRLALKAQSQCRTTIEALANIKNPRPLAYVQQANIGQAVQVNNRVAAEEIGKAPNELLEARHANERLDYKAPCAAGATHQELETVGAIHRSPDVPGEV